MDPIHTATPLEGEIQTELSLRPKFLREYIGQNKVKENLFVSLEAARRRKEPLDHVLLFGPPGLGKTTLASIIGNEMNAYMKQTSGPALEKTGDIVAVLTNLEAGEILFIDEIHRTPAPVEEVLYSAMEDFYVDVVVGQGPAARTMKFDLPRFTLIGATTRSGLLTWPLLNRFGYVGSLRYYDEDDLTKIVTRSARLLDVTIAPEGAREIGRRSRGTPRIANRLLRRVRDFAEVRHQGAIDLDIARQALAMLEVDEYGLDEVDRKLLTTIIERFGGGPVGLNALGSSIAEDKGTIEDLYEPYLIQIGFLQRTPRGRVATRIAYEHLGYALGATRKQSNLFSS